MIVNCHAVGLNWERASLSAYLEAIAATDPENRETGPTTDPEYLRKFMRAHAKS